MFRVGEKKIIFPPITISLAFWVKNKTQDSEGFVNLYLSSEWVAFCCVCGVCVVYDVCVGWLVCIGWWCGPCMWCAGGSAYRGQSRTFLVSLCYSTPCLEKGSVLTVFSFLHGLWIWVFMLVEHVLVHWAMAPADTLKPLVWNSAILFSLSHSEVCCVFNEFAVSS